MIKKKMTEAERGKKVSLSKETKDGNIETVGDAYLITADKPVLFITINDKNAIVIRDMLRPYPELKDPFRQTIEIKNAMIIFYDDGTHEKDDKFSIEHIAMILWEFAEYAVGKKWDVNKSEFWMIGNWGGVALHSDHKVELKGLYKPNSETFAIWHKLASLRPNTN